MLVKDLLKEDQKDVYGTLAQDHTVKQVCSDAGKALAECRKVKEAAKKYKKVVTRVREYGFTLTSLYDRNNCFDWPEAGEERSGGGYPPSIYKKKAVRRTTIHQLTTIVVSADRQSMLHAV